MYEDVTRQLSEWSAGLRTDALPPAVRAEATRLFLNFCGCALGGMKHPGVTIALAVSDEFAGRPSVSLIGTGRRADPLTATFVNAMASAVHTFDDTHLGSINHPGGVVGSAAMASAGPQVRGAEFVTAVAAGIEAMCRLGNVLMRPPAACPIGLSMMGATGAVGAAVASGMLMGLTVDQLQAAIGIAAAQAGGLREMHGTMTSSFIPGHAARCGVLAARLAARGFTAGGRSIEGPSGLAEVFGRPGRAESLVEGLGAEFEILQVAIKPYPCGVAIFPAIDACLEIAAKIDVLPDAIRSVRLTVSPVGLRLTGRRAPKDSLEAQVSLFHWVAATLLRGRASVPEGADDSVRDSVVVAFRDRIEAVADPGLGPEAAHAVVTLADGRELSSTIVHCRGSAGRPLTDAEVAEKFLAQAVAVIGRERADAFLACFQDRFGDRPLAETLQHVA